MITVATFEKPEDAYLARSVLEGSGIRAVVEGDLVVNLAWMYSNAIGGVKVQVNSEEAERARDVLIRAKMNVVPSTPELPRCSVCKSQKVERQKSSPQVFFLSILLLGLPLLFLRRRRHCLDCGHTWKGNP